MTTMGDVNDLFQQHEDRFAEELGLNASEEDIEAGTRNAECDYDENANLERLYERTEEL